MMATFASSQFQVAICVMSWVVLSENVPIAWNAFVNPFGTVAPIGLMTMDESVTFLMVSWVEPMTESDVAVMKTLPGFTPVARPLLPAASPTVATRSMLDDQVAVAVRSCVVPSE